MTNQNPIRTVPGEYEEIAKVQGSSMRSGNYVYLQVGDDGGFSTIKLTLADARLLAQVLVLTAVELEDATR